MDQSHPTMSVQSSSPGYGRGRYGLNDTHPDAERILIRIRRNQSPAERLALAMSLTGFAVTQAERCLASSDTDPYPSRERLASHLYGQHLVSRLIPQTVA
ncbi:MAG: hypothetical protein AAF797_09820 [Planctomycetota bacterium]